MALTMILLMVSCLFVCLCIKECPPVSTKPDLATMQYMLNHWLSMLLFWQMFALFGAEASHVSFHYHCSIQRCVLFNLSTTYLRR